MSKKATCLVVLTAFALALPLALPARSGTLPATIVPDGVRWVAHLDMEKFVATKLFEYLEKSGRFEIKNRELDSALKIDVTKDIAGLTVFGSGPGEKQAVFAVAGKFDKAHLLSLLALDKEHQEIPYGAYTIHSTGDGAGAFLNDGLIIYSESREAVEKVLDTAAGKAKPFGSSRLAAALKNVPAGAFFSGVVEDLTGLAKEIGQSKLVEKASGMFFAAQENQDTLQVRLQMTADTPENTKNIADLVQGLIALGRLSERHGDAAGIASLAEGIQVKQDGTTVRVEFDRPSREIADLLSRGRGLGALLF